VLSSASMRRSIALLALLSVLAASADRLPAARTAGMPCCRGAASMACCLPAAGGAVRSCPPVERADAALPGLPPAVIGALVAEEPLAPIAVLVPPLAGSPLARIGDPPRRPPRA
jgi:hypothetical protein